MDPAAVAAFYQAKGYSVREGARVPGLSGNEHKVPILAEGPLGSLAVFFGDFGGVDGPEMGGARKAARDIGATPVLAADEFSNNDRQVAARLGVVLLDGTMMAEDPPAAPPAPSSPAAAWPGLPLPDPRPARRTEPEQHPWPASGRVGGHDGPSARAIDIDDLLADTRRAPARAEEPMEQPVEEPAASAPPVGEPDDAEALWRRPRAVGAAATAGTGHAASRGRQGTKFAWLSSDAKPREGKGGKDGKDGGFAVDYDDVVAAKGRRDGAADGDAAADGDGGPGPSGRPRLGEDPDLAPTMEQVERRQRRDRLQRRVFWALFAFVFLYLLWAFWNGQIGN